MVFFINRSPKKPKKKKKEKRRAYLDLASYDETMIQSKAQEELEKELPGQRVFAPEILEEKMKGIRKQVGISITKKKIFDKLNREIDADKKNPCKNLSL